MGLAAIVVLLLVIFLWDNVANFGKAYGNVFVDGKSVAGMTAEQIKSSLEDEYGDKLTKHSVRIYASDSAASQKTSDIERQENAAQAEQISVESAKKSVTSWKTSASGLRASIPYEVMADQAIQAGRNDGPLGRLALFFAPVHIDFSIEYNERAIEELASAIDAAIGDPRVDAGVVIEDGVANAVKGHDGKMVNRSWLQNQITEALLSDVEESSFVASVEDAPSRTTMEQAQQMSSDVNRALNSGLTFKFKGQKWQAEPSALGNWTNVYVAQASDGYELKARIDSTLATADLAKHLDASVTGDNIKVEFSKSGSDVMVRTSGSGIIPEVAPAVSQAQDLLYGSAGIAWGNGGAGSAEIEVNESDAPEELTFAQAIDLGVVTMVSEYTTEFSNAEGTENRNHNIKLAADILNNTIAKADGGTWSFNDHSGDTNQDPPFASAGSIVNGEYVDSIGGGICQVATTVFNAVYEAGLDIVERRNHSLYIESYPTGRDAAVSYPEMDFVWSNSHTSDVLLTLSCTDTTITAQLYSTPIGYKVSTATGEWEEGEKYSTVYETDETLASGSYYLKTIGTDGSQITIERTVTDMNGAVVKQDSFASVYAPKNEVYLMGPGTDVNTIASQNASEADAQSEDLDYAYDETADDSVAGYDEDAYAQEGLSEEYYDDTSVETGLEDGTSA